MKSKRAKHKMTYEKRKSLSGFLFVLPWFIGFIFLFFKPLIKSFIFSINKLDFEVTGIEYTFIGLSNYINAFTVDSKFVIQLSAAVKSMLYQVPMILMFSLFIAIILNQKFRGRLIVRAIFFLPVIIASGVVMDIMLHADVNSVSMMSGDKSSIVNVYALGPIFEELGFPISFTNYIINIANNIFQLTWKAGIQILIFLAGLQTIPNTVYEASSIEGATRWEIFWKITFPMISPIIMVNLVYTIIDNFTDYSNPLIQAIRKSAQEMKLSYSAAMSWIYFAFIIIVLLVIFLIVNKKVVYMNEGD